MKDDNVKKKTCKKKTGTKKRRERAVRGTGTIFFNDKKNRWVGRKIVGRSGSGSPVYVERWGKTQEELLAKLADAGPPDPDTLTVEQWAVRWKKTLTGRDSTRNNCRISLEHHLLPALGSLRLADVTTADVESLIARMLTAELGVGTVGKIVAHARAMFGAAVRADVIQRNPAAHAKKPRHTPAEIEAFSPEQLARIITASAPFASGGVVAILGATGLRVGEALALDVSDWKPAAGTLAVTKTYSLRHGIGEPKSRHSRRTVTVPDVVFAVLNDAVDGRTAGPLFRTEAGNRRPAQTVAKGWKATLRAAKLPYRKLHTLRHSVATALIGANVPIPDVARYIGDTVTTLVRCYVHPTWADPAHTLNRLYGVRKVGDAESEATKHSKS